MIFQSIRIVTLLLPCTLLLGAESNLWVMREGDWGSLHNRHHHVLGRRRFLLALDLLQIYTGLVILAVLSDSQLDMSNSIKGDLGNLGLP